VNACVYSALELQISLDDLVLSVDLSAARNGVFFYFKRYSKEQTAKWIQAGWMGSDFRGGVGGIFFSVSYLTF
jgi:hypothetical protein